MRSEKREKVKGKRGCVLIRVQKDQLQSVRWQLLWLEAQQRSQLPTGQPADLQLRVHYPEIRVLRANELPIKSSRTLRRTVRRE